MLPCGFVQRMQPLRRMQRPGPRPAACELRARSLGARGFHISAQPRDQFTVRVAPLVKLMPKRLIVPAPFARTARRCGDGREQ